MNMKKLFLFAFVMLAVLSSVSFAQYYTDGPVHYPGYGAQYTGSSVYGNPNNYPNYYYQPYQYNLNDKNQYYTHQNYQYNQQQYQPYYQQYQYSQPTNQVYEYTTIHPDVSCGGYFFSHPYYKGETDCTFGTTQKYQYYGYTNPVNYIPPYQGFVDYDYYCEDPPGNEGETRILGINPRAEFVCRDGKWRFVRGIPTQNPPVVYHGARSKLEFYDCENFMDYRNFDCPQKPERYRYDRYSDTKYGGILLDFGFYDGYHFDGYGDVYTEPWRNWEPYDYYSDPYYGGYPPPAYTQPVGNDTVTIEAREDSYTPQTVRIKKGMKVRWLILEGTNWPAGDIHPTHSNYPNSDSSECGTQRALDNFDACKVLDRGEVYEFTFHHTGTWHYHNHLNPNIKGTVVVEN